MEAKQNMRVDVYDLDKHYLGTGTITKVEPLDVEMDDGSVERLVDNYPTEIRLDNGEITEGMNCWWTPKEDKTDLDRINTKWNVLRNKYNYAQECLRGHHGDAKFVLNAWDANKLDHELDEMYNFLIKGGYTLNKETQAWSKDNA